MSKYNRRLDKLAHIPRSRIEAALAEAPKGHDVIKMPVTVFVDVYDVLYAFGVDNPATQHAIKKQLMPGGRGHKDKATDYDEAIASLKRAVEIERLVE